MEKNIFTIPAVAAAIAIVSFSTLTPLAAILSCILGSAMLAISVSDMREFIIPDVISLPAIPAGLVATWLIVEQPDAPRAVLEHALAALGAGGALYALARIYEALRGHAGLGLGDVKLLAAGGAWIGWQALPSVLLIASLTALGFVAFLKLTRGTSVGAKTPLPFGVFLAPAIWIVWIGLQMPFTGLWFAATAG